MPRNYQLHEYTMVGLVDQVTHCNGIELPCEGRCILRSHPKHHQAAHVPHKALFDEYACDKCGESTTPVWKLDHEFRKKRICRLNDEMRIGNFKNGSVVMTRGIQTLSDEWRAAIVDQISRFEDFSEDNDPHGEHDFGSLEVAGNKIFWKIDYFDLRLKWHSPDAADPDVTHRVLTIMMASEY